MKDFIIKNKKIVSVGLVVLSILFLILVISNLNSTKRGAYQSMYDANNELRETYIDAAEKFEEYGYSSKAQTYYSKAYALNDEIERYKSELTSLNVQVAIFALLAVASGITVVWLVKKKENVNSLNQLSEADLNISKGETI